MQDDSARAIPNQLALLVRAMNYSVGKQEYTVVFITTLAGISAVTSSIHLQGGDKVKTGVCVTVEEGNLNIGECCMLNLCLYTHIFQRVSVYNGYKMVHQALSSM